MTDDGEIKVSIFKNPINPLSPFRQLDLQFDSYLREHICDDLPCPFRIGESFGQFDDRFKSIRVSRLGEKLFGLLRAIRIHRGEINIIRVAWVHMTSNKNTIA